MAGRFSRMAILKVQHRTTYRYSEPVSFGEHRWMFRPRDSYEQRLIRADHQISPKPAETGWRHDVFGNQIAVLDFDAQASELSFESSIALEHTEQSGPHFRPSDRGRTWPFDYDPDTETDISAKLLLALTQAVRNSGKYTRRTDPGTQPPALTLATRSGTCRDFALLMMEAARVLGFAARFVTGYIYVPARDDGVIRGGGATHAWVQIFLPGAGWVEYDPTNGIIGTRDLIRIGVARDPRQARPLSGSFAGERGTYLGMEVDVIVHQLVDAVDAERDRATVSFRG
jgi:transglutaminase-like putative cysteine protease